MQRSPLISHIKSDQANSNVPRVYARFNLNRYAEYAIASDADRINTIRPPRSDFGRVTFAETSNLMVPFRHGHGVEYPFIGPSSSDTEKIQPISIIDMKTSGKKRIMPFMPSSDNAYKFYISSTNSSSRTDDVKLGYKAVDGLISDIKLSYNYPSDLSEDDPYFQLVRKNVARAKNNLYDAPDIYAEGIPTKPMFLYGNAVHFKFNTIASTPRWFRVYVGWRAYDSDTQSITETKVYDSSIDGVPHISTGEVYSATSISNYSGYCQIQLNSSTTTIKDGEHVVINRVHNQVNGTYRVLSVDYSSGTIVVDAPYSESFSSSGTGQIYSAYPGELTLHMPENWNGSQAWSEKANYWTGDDDLIGITYVRLEVESVSKKKAQCEIIEVMPSLYADFSGSLQSVDISLEASSNDSTMIVGALTSNSATVTMNNTSRLFDTSNYRRKTSAGWTGSPISNMLTGYVEFWIDNEFRAEDGSLHTSRIATMVSDTWSSDDSTATISLTDYAKVFQERGAPDAFFRSSRINRDREGMRNMSNYKDTFRNKGGYNVTAIVSNIMAAVGWTQVMSWPETGSVLSEPKLKYFWSKREQTVWEVLQEIAEQTQTAIFFDRYGYLRVLPRDILNDYTRSDESVNGWRLRGLQQKDAMTDIKSVSKQEGVPVNQVNVSYTTYSTVNENYAANTVFWNPPENMQLRLAEVVGKITKGSNRIKIKPNNAGIPFPPSGSITFANVSVDYQASSFFRTFGLPRGSKKNSPWEKWWVANDEGRQELKELNDGYDVVPGNELFIRNGLNGDESPYQIRYDISDPEDMTYVDGWRVRYVIDGARARGGEIDGSQWRTFSRNNECWVLNCRRSEYPRKIKVPKDSDVGPNDQYLMAFRNFETDDVKTIDRIVTKFRFMEIDRGAKAGITLYNHMGGKRDRFYTVMVKPGDKFPNKKGTEPIVRMQRIDDDGTPFMIKSKFAKETGKSIERYEWCVLELEVIKSKRGKDGKFNYEFNVYLNGWKIGSFEDYTEKSLTPNARAGFFVSNGVVQWDGYAAVEEGGNSPVKPAKNAKQRKKLRGRMDKTQRKIKKPARRNTKTNNAGNKASRPKGSNKTRRRNG